MSFKLGARIRVLSRRVIGLLARTKEEKKDRIHDRHTEGQ
jgi:hypothetical protein